MESLSTEEKFRAAVNVIRSLPKKGAFQPSNELMLKFYSYYKQATEGPCTTSKPSFWDVINKAKWEAWKGLGNMPKEEAMTHYIDELKKIVETMSYTESVAEFVDILGPFYEFVPLDDTDIKPDVNGSQESDDNNDTVIKEIVENNIGNLDTISVTESLKKQLKSKKANGDIRNDSSFNSGQFPEATFNALNSANGHKENGAEESETDEYSDTYDQIANEEETENGNCLEDTSTLQVDNADDLADSSLPKGGKYNRITKARGGGDQRSGSTGKRDGGSGGRRDRNPQSRDPGHLPHISPPLYPQSGVGAGGSGNNGDGATGGGHPVDVGEQLALAVIKLQHTMDEVVSRLDSLEILLQEKQHDRSTQETEKRRQWSVLGLSPSAAVFIVLWPFVAHWMMSIMKKKKQHR